MQRPAGITAIAILCFLNALYLAGLGTIMLFAPGTVSMALGAPLLLGLELAGPYMFLLIAAIAALIGFGLLRLNNFARRAAALVSVVGVVALVPTVSASVVTLSVRTGLGRVGRDRSRDDRVVSVAAAGSGGVRINPEPPLSVFCHSDPKGRNPLSWATPLRFDASHAVAHQY